jgi:uncharacterized protein
MISPLNSALSPDEIDQLAERLDAIENPDALSLEGVDGLFCALIASPASVPPSVYLPIILGGEPGNSGVFADLEDAQATMSLLMRYWNSIIADVERESIHLPFVFEVEPSDVPGRDWAYGFMVGVELAPDGWDELFNDENEEDLSVIPLVAGDVDPEWPEEPVTPELQDDVLKSMAVGFARAYQRFRSRQVADCAAAYDRMVEAGAVADVETYRRTEAKIGRNESCPCGSGKKYKRCCGAGDDVLH